MIKDKCIYNNSYRHKMVIHFIVFALLIIFFGKAFFVESNYFLLYLYGATVTFVLLITFFVAMFKYEDPALVAEEKLKNEKEANGRGELFISCMVAVWNEENFIEQCIKSLVKQTYKNKEVIFVDDGSTDNTGKILDDYAKKGIIRVIHQKNSGKKKALGQAMKIAKGELFAFSDSDSIWANDAIEKIVKIFQTDQSVGGVSGHCRALNANKNLLTKIQDSWYEGQFSIRKAFESVFGAVTCVSGPLAVFRKDAIYNYIPAWENDSFLNQEFKFATDRTLTGFVLGNKTIEKKLKKKYCESPFVKDVDYSSKNWKIVYAKSAKSWTIVPDTIKKMLKQQIRWKKSFLRNIFFTGFFYWKKPLLPSLFYYLHIVFVLIGPFIAFRHLIYLPIRGDIFSAFLYMAGIIFVGFMFGFAYKLENPKCHIWIYRPLMSLTSTLFLSWIIFYSVLTIKRMTWSRI